MQQIKTRDIVDIMRRTLDCVDDRLMHHGEKVAFLIYKMMKKQNIYDKVQIRNLCLIAMLHDIGAYKTEEIDKMVQFETGDVWQHSIYGCLFIKSLSPLNELSDVIRYHHLEYQKLKELHHPMEAWIQMLTLADRVDVFTHMESGCSLAEYFNQHRGGLFDGAIIDFFLELDAKEGVVEQMSDQECLNRFLDDICQTAMSESEIEQFLKMVVFSIDFRSPFTVMHTITITGIGVELAAQLGLSLEEQQKIRFAALIHDLGKIAVPVEILEHPGKLSYNAMKIMKTHVELTDQILSHNIEEEIRKIALRHHEKLDGSGYPLGLMGEDLTLKERILAVADIVSALLGRRSYKEPYDKEVTLSIIIQMKEEGKLCPVVVDVMVKHYEEILERVQKICAPVIDSYEKLNRCYVEEMKQLTGS